MVCICLWYVQSIYLVLFFNCSLLIEAINTKNSCFCCCSSSYNKNYNTNNKIPIRTTNRLANTIARRQRAQLEFYSHFTFTCTPLSLALAQHSHFLCSEHSWMILISAVMLWLGWFLISYYFWHILITFSHFFGKFW